MIICISGGVGSGKSITAVHHAVEESKNNLVLTNFTLKKIKNYYRLKRTDVIDTQTNTEQVGDKIKTTQETVVNWDFWNDSKHQGSDVFLDEVHNLINSRNGMSKQNRVLNEWVSQIRKVWGTSGDVSIIDKIQKFDNNLFNKYWVEFLARSNNLYYITQRPRKADVNWRELTHVHIRCSKQIIDGKVIIFNHIWFGDDNLDPFEAEEMGVLPKVHVFVANKYFDKYESYEIIRGQGEYL